jgi:putative addiction module component (TIGR02574 family)
LLTPFLPLGLLLAFECTRWDTLNMSSAELAQRAMELPPEERLDLARRLVESVGTPDDLKAAIAEGVRRIEDLMTGRVQGLSEEELRTAVQ